MTIKANQIERYYDTHQLKLEGDELGQSRLHFFAIKYLLLILEWLFESKNQKVGIVSDINFYQTTDKGESPKQPDLAVVDGLEVVPEREEDYSPSYYVGADGPPPRVVFELLVLAGLFFPFPGADGPPPRVVFEVASLETWRADLEQKPLIYAKMGVKEYFVFDPQPKLGVWTREWRDKNRLIGWRLQSDGSYQELEKDAQGQIWSEQLESWLVMQGKRLRLYTAEGELRLNSTQAARQRAEAERQRAEAERRRADKAELKATLAQRKAEEEAQKVEAIEQVRQALAAENARLLEKLRELEQNS